MFTTVTAWVCMWKFEIIKRIIFCVQNFYSTSFFGATQELRYSLYIYTSIQKHCSFSSSPIDGIGQGRVGWLDSICLFRKEAVLVLKRIV